MPKFALAEGPTPTEPVRPAAASAFWMMALTAAGSPDRSEPVARRISAT